MVTYQESIAGIALSRHQRYLKALSVLKKVTDILINKYRVSKVILIGSLVNPYCFGFHSDIDLCVEGLSDEFYFQAVGELLLAADEFDIDIIPFESISQSRKMSIEKGKILYEKQ
jgi:uncharacterized protein